MNPRELIDIRCTLQKRSKTSKKVYNCNNLCVRVYPGSSGEAYCTSCKVTFDFEIVNQSSAYTFIKAKKVA